MNHLVNSIIFILCSKLILSFSSTRYETIVKELFHSYQSNSLNLTTTISSQTSDVVLYFDNFKLISPILSLVEFEYSSTINPLKFNANNDIFTYIVNVNAKVSKNTVITYKDFLFQFSCKKMEFYIENKVKMTLKDIECKELFFSLDTSFGALKIFNFFNNNSDTNNHFIELFRSNIQEKANKWFTLYNLIYFDVQSIFNDMETYFSKKQIEYHYDNYTITNLTVVKHEYTDKDMKFDMNTNELLFKTLIIYFKFDYSYYESPFQKGEFDVTFSDWKISHKTFSKDEIRSEYSFFCEEHPELCNGIVKDAYHTAFLQDFCEYFSDVIIKEECLKQ